MNNNPSASTIEAGEIVTPKDCVRELYRENGGVKQAMVTVGVNKTRAYAFASNDAKDEISFLGVVRLTSPRAVAAAKYLARRAGGFFCVAPTREGHAGLSVLTAKTMTSHGKAMAEIVKDFGDGKLDARETTKARKLVHDAMCDLGALDRMLAATLEPEA